MSTTEADVLAALNSVNALYVDMTKRDILNALSEFCDLYPGTDSYVFNDGTCRKVVTLTGTVPINYKGNTYNIPVCLYLLDTHPNNAPMCYVRPTPDMLIRTGQHVDANGQIFLPYLHEWRHPKSDLLGLLQIMVIIFGEQCPVFAKPSSAPASLASTGGSIPAGIAYAPYPGMPGSTSANAPGSFGINQSMGSVSRPFYAPYGPGSIATTSTPTTFNSHAGFAWTVAYSSPKPPFAQTMQSENARLNLITVVEERLRIKLRETIGQSYAELQSIRLTREELNSGEQKLKSMFAKIKEEQDGLDTAVSKLKTSIGEMDTIMEEAGVGDESPIDEAIDTTTPLFRQLLNAYVEDNAIEDTVYNLGESLKRGRMDLDNYLKHIRMLSRQQFMLRETMQRCRRVAGIDA